MALRELCYTIKQDSFQPDWWIAKGQGKKDACIAKLVAGMPKSPRECGQIRRCKKREAL